MNTRTRRSFLRCQINLPHAQCQLPDILEYGPEGFYDEFREVMIWAANFSGCDPLVDSIRIDVKLVDDASALMCLRELRASLQLVLTQKDVVECDNDLFTIICERQKSRRTRETEIAGTGRTAADHRSGQTLPWLNQVASLEKRVAKKLASSREAAGAMIADIAQRGFSANASGYQEAYAVVDALHRLAEETLGWLTHRDRPIWLRRLLPPVSEGRQVVFAIHDLVTGEEIRRQKRMPTLGIIQRTFPCGELLQKYAETQRQRRIEAFRRSLVDLVGTEATDPAHAEQIRRQVNDQRRDLGVSFQVREGRHWVRCVLKTTRRSFQLAHATQQSPRILSGTQFPEILLSDDHYP